MHGGSRTRPRRLPPEEAALVDAPRAVPGAWTEGLSRVAVDDAGLPVGRALPARCHIGDRPALCPAPVAVHPPSRGTFLRATP
ncbi:MULTISPECIES: hypothetical protein [Streptomyces]|uniref:Uncharacterized protein n=1 Tax=Streptomyces lienomycini TaxID=284035 RepID=A0ABV9WNH3_9ACTN|nr:hypothetical protein [Streptomyces lienomycini]